MRTLRIENFRAFEDETIDFGEYTCFLGPNGAGKSTILMALNVFFRNPAGPGDVTKLGQEDFHHKNVTRPIKITLTFNDLTQSEQENWAHYYRQDQLVLFAKAEWDESARHALVIQHGSRLVIVDFAPFFEAFEAGAKVADLREIYNTKRNQYRDLPVETTEDRMREALRSYEETHPESCQLRDDPAQLYGYTRGAHKLEDSIKWVYVPAVKDASTEDEESGKTALGELLKRTIRARVDFSEPLAVLKDDLEDGYRRMLEDRQGVLADLTDSLQKKLRDWSHPGAILSLRWDYDSQKTLQVNEPLARVEIGEDGFIGKVGRLGHGMQRAFLVSILQELAAGDQTGGPTLLLGIEEPELYQHPPQARHMAQLLRKLAEQSANNAQVIITTHSPYFVDCQRFSAVRMVRKDHQHEKAHVRQTDFVKLTHRLTAALQCAQQNSTGLLAAVVQIMQPSQNELFFAGVPVIVEGVEDVAYLASYLQLTDQQDEFRRLGCHFVIAAGKPNLSRLLAIAQEFEVPAFVVFDTDSPHTRQQQQTMERDNRCLLRLLGEPEATPFPEDSQFGRHYVQWVPTIGKAVCTDVGQDRWATTKRRVVEELQIEGKQAEKKCLVITRMLELLFEDNVRFPSLLRACSTILRYGQQVRP